MRHEAARLYAKLRDHRRKVDLSLALINRALDSMPNPYISFSGGKDSTVVMDLVRRIRPDTPAQYGHEQWLLPETDAIISRTDNLVITALPDHHTEWFSVWDDPADVPDGVIYIDPAKYDEFNYQRLLLGFDGCFLGLRAAENSYRYMHLATHGPLAYCKRHGMTECSPIHNWSTLDVWAYIVDRELDYNAAYDRLAELGVPLDHQRIGPLAQWRALNYGQIAILKRGWPELYNSLAAMYPQVIQYS